MGISGARMSIDRLHEIIRSTIMKKENSLSEVPIAALF